MGVLDLVWRRVDSGAQGGNCYTLLSASWGEWVLFVFGTWLAIEGVGVIDPLIKRHDKTDVGCSHGDTTEKMRHGPIVLNGRCGFTTALKKATSFHRVQARAIVLHDQIRFITRPVKDLMLCNDWIKYPLKAFFWYLSSVQIKWLYDLLNVFGEHIGKFKLKGKFSPRWVDNKFEWLLCKFGWYEFVLNID